MCGIAGAVNWGTPESLARMTEVQRHRGPDDSGTWHAALPTGGWIGLGARRLAILDLSAAGHMPMQTADGRYTIVYNGEIYNYQELRKQLEADGIRFRSQTDTEVVLYLFQRFGPDCFKKLNGMFALGIWDRDREELFVARDHFGIKPLYYIHSGEKFAFASEMKALLELPGFQRDLNYAALDQYLTFLWIPDPLTMINGVLKMPPGYYGTLRRGRFELHQYWDLELPDAASQYPQSEEDLARELRERFGQVVRRQMLSDVPVGAFLSAGLDSSTIVAAMRQASSTPLRTYTVSVADRYRRGSRVFDDPAVARATAEHFGCLHTDIEASPDCATLLPHLIWQMDEPIADPAILACYLVNREARKDVTVMLAGNGGDEIFGGYRKYRAHYLGQLYQRIPRALRRKLIEPGVGALPALQGSVAARYMRFAKKIVRSGSLPPRERFIKHSIHLTPEAKHELYSPRIGEQLAQYEPRNRHLEHFQAVGHADFLNQMLYVDVKTFLVSLNLTYNDKMSMASSVEVRVPFLDWEFVQWSMTNIPPQLKLHGSSTKHILRQAMRDELPAEVLRQPKAGFNAPIEFWLTEQLSEMVGDVLSDESVRRRGLFSVPAVRSIVNRERSDDEDWAYQIWQLLTLELWMQSYLDSSGSSTTAVA